MHVCTVRTFVSANEDCLFPIDFLASLEIVF